MEAATIFNPVDNHSVRYLLKPYYYTEIKYLQVKKPIISATVVADDA